MHVAMPLRISSKLHRDLLALAAGSPDREVCGLLVGEGNIDSVLKTANVATDPSRSFEIDPVALFAAIRAERAEQRKILGYFHSHPVSPPKPSRRDTEMAPVDGKIWVIIGEGKVTAWRKNATNEFKEIALQITD
jgi:desampylase